MERFKRFAAANFSCVYFTGMLMFMELVFHIAIFKDLRVLYPMLSVLPTGLILGFLTDLFKKAKTRKIIYWTVSIALFLLYASQVVYYRIFFSFWTMAQVTMAGDAVTNFFTAMLIAIGQSALKLIILALPMIALPFGLKKRKQVRVTRRHRSRYMPVRQKRIIVIALAVIIYLCNIFVMLPLGGKGAYTPYDLYHNTWVMDLSVQKLGMLYTAKSDLQYAIFGFDEEVTLDVDAELESTLTEEEISSSPEGSVIGSETESSVIEPAVDTSPNVLDIDFEALAAAEEDEDLKTLHTYFANLPPTGKNEYTGMFEGYNLILICAESFSPAAVVDEELTPALWKLTHEGFVFENYWTTFPSNTTNGEYTFLTGLFPDTARAKTNGTFVASKDNCLPFCMGSVLRGEGVNSVAYHGHTASYYKRKETHPTIGYLTYKGRNELGLTGWPESDLDTVKKSIDEYINDERFHVYYMSVSGHHNYKMSDVNSMVERNEDTVLNYAKLDGYSEAAKSYVACNLELEYALEYLLDTLEQKGLLENTVIALASDHYPYGLTDKEHAEFLGGELDWGGMERYKSNFILWSGSMEEPVYISKPCCSVDVLPTLLNLFGIEYDSRLLSGKDILSDSKGMAVLANQSFITDTFIYNNSNEKVYSLNGEEVDEVYLDRCIAQVKNKFTVATAISVNDYYDLVVPKDYVGRVWKTQTE